MSERKGCGCQEGSKVGAAYIVALPFLSLLTPLRAGELRSWGIALAGLLGAAVIGKVYGMVRARMQPAELSNGTIA